MNHIKLNPIGHFYCRQSEKYMAPKQPGMGLESGHIVFEPGNNYEQALEDLEGFSRIWVIFLFDRNPSWKPKVMTPRGGSKKGVFSTRSPHRPNPIGLSCVELLKVEGRLIYVGNNDLLDGTPILDIKPYLPYADAFPESLTGWASEESPIYSVEWSEIAKSAAEFIERRTGINFIHSVEVRLANNPFPFPSHRIKSLNDDLYELAMKTWRVHYTIIENHVIIKKIVSGYDAETLSGLKKSKWDDVPVHIELLERT